jgi:hypothetical protein
MATVLVIKEVKLGGETLKPGAKAEVSGPALDNLIRKGRIQPVATVAAEPEVQNADPEPDAREQKSKRK